MKIEERISNYMALLNSEPPKPAADAGGSSEAAASTGIPSVAVEISPAAVQLSDDEARRERLNIIRQQLAEGSYNISGKDVAHKILNVIKG